MDQECPKCKAAWTSENRPDCPLCGFRMAEHLLRVDVEQLQEEVKQLEKRHQATFGEQMRMQAGWQAECDRLKDAADAEVKQLQANLSDCVHAKTLAESDRSAQEVEIRRLQAKLDARGTAADEERYQAWLASQAKGGG